MVFSFFSYYDVDMGKTETGRTYTADSILFDVNKDLSTADATTPNSVIVVPGLLPIYSEGSKTIIGFALVDDTDPDGRTHARLFLDYSTPERLELENGERRYLHAIVVYEVLGGSIIADAPALQNRFYIQHLEISAKKNKAETAIGEI